MKIVSNWRGFWHAKSLIEAGKVNKVDEFSFSASNAQTLLGDSGNNFDALSAFHLGENIEAITSSKERFVYPYGKDGFVFRSALEDIVVKAGKSGDSAVIDYVNQLIQKIDRIEESPTIDMNISVQAAWEVKETEIRHRIKEPGLFDSCRSKDITTGVRAIFCRLSSDKKTWQMQALRFDRDKFNLEEAKSWIKKHPLAASKIEENEIDSLQTCEALNIENPIQASESEFKNSGLPILASVSKTGDGSVWDVTIFKAGFAPAKPPVFISKKAIKASEKVFEGSRVYANNDADYYGHKTDRSKKGVREIVGVLKGGKAIGDELHYNLHILPSAQWLKDDLLFLSDRNALSTYQLSIDSGFYQNGTVFSQEANSNVPNVIAVAGGDVDIVPNGAAGGQFNKIAASKNTDSNSHNNNLGVTKIMKNKLIAIFAAMFPVIFAAKNIDVVGIDENELYSFLYAANKAQPRMNLPEGFDKVKVEPIIDAALTKIQATKVDDPPPVQDPPAGDPPPAVDIKAALDPVTKRIQEIELKSCQNELRAAVAESKLPDVVQKEVLKQYHGKIFASADLQATIDSFRQIAAHFSNNEVNNRGMDIQITATEASKMENALAATILCSGHQNYPLQLGSDAMKKIVGDAAPLRSIKQLYIDCTGDVGVTGNPAKMTKLMAATGIDTTQFSVIVGNALNKALVTDYNYQDKLADINKVCNIVDLNSIQEQKRIRYGGYADAAVVAEGDAYLPATSPDDEEAVYTPTKKGFTEDITLETIKKDDINAVNKIPGRISKACINKFYKTVFGLLDPGQNALVYDSVAMYDLSTHVNYGTGALDATYLKAAIARMLAQTEAGSSEILGIRPGFLLVPAELEGTGYELLTAAYGQYNEVATYAQSKQIQLLGVPYWSGLTVTYGNKAKNWALVSRREDGVPIEAGFVDGQRTPELFVSNLANVGSLFTNDKITYKVRFWFGAAVIDFRFADGSVVS